MKILIVTVAGSSTRFSKSIGHECLKCIYSDNDIKDSLLYGILSKAADFDKYVIVGGYKFAELDSVLKRDFSEFADKIVLIENKKYAEHGSGYSLYLGIKKCLEYDFDEIVFAEGDLFVDGDSFDAIARSSRNAITVNTEPIYSNKAVALYIDAHDKINYIYDVDHSLLRIDEPFKAIFNSGQVWKFNNKAAVRRAFDALTEEAWHGTNLVFVQKYFGDLSESEYEIVTFKNWINCNTLQDYKKIKEIV